MARRHASAVTKTKRPSAVITARICDRRLERAGRARIVLPQNSETVTGLDIADGDAAQRIDRGVELSGNQQG